MGVLTIHVKERGCFGI